MISKRRKVLHSRRASLSRLSSNQTPSVKQNTEPSFNEICRECGAQCCKPLLQEPIFHINIGLEASLFIEHKLCGLLPSSGKYNADGIPSITLSHHIMGYCPFLDYPKSTCSIHEKPYRPRACHTFPFTLAYDPSLNDKCLYKQAVSRKRFKIIGNQTLGECNKKLPSSVHKHNQVVRQISEYWRKRDYWLLNNRPKKVMNYDHGIYYMYDSISEPLLDLFFKFVRKYTTALAYKELFVNVSILNSNYQEIGQIVGAFAPQRVLSLDDIQLFHDKYYQSVDESEDFPPNILTGVCQKEELTHHPPHWKECLQIMRRLAGKYKQKSEFIGNNN